MPRGDGTGPMGTGAMTGRGAGFCAGFQTPGYMNPTAGRGMGMGRGRGWGRGFGMGMAWRHGWAVNPWQAGPVPVVAAPQNELKALKNQAKYLGESLDSITKRIAEIESAPK